MAVNIGRGDNGTAIRFGSGVGHEVERVWHLEQVRPFLENPDSGGPGLIARFYGGVARIQERRVWERLHLEYGIVEIMPGVVGREWPAFPGHLHRGPQRTPFPAVLEVLHGEAGLYLQKDGSFDRIHEASILWLRRPDRVLVPPGYAHVLMNCGTEVLVVAEVHSSATLVDFDEMARHRGAGYYLGPQGARPNPHYRAHPPLRELRAALMAAPGAGPQDLYQAVMAAPDRYRFLHPL